jgi:uncharacterized protein YbjT (DUF2867 family)
MGMIAVVGATGSLGRELSLRLLAGGHHVVAITREPARAAVLEKLGAEVRRADLADPGSLAGAILGADTVAATAHSLLGRGRYSSSRVDDVGHRALIDAARAAGVDHFLYTSVYGASASHPVAFWRRKHAVERHLQASGLRYTILRPTAFMETHAHELLGKAILSGGTGVVFGSGERPANFVAARDAAALAALVLTQPSAKGLTIEIGGPENFTRHEVAALYGRLSQRSPKLRHVPVGALRFFSALLRPFHPGLSEAMSASVVAETTDQTFDPSEMLRQYPITLTRLEEFVHERVAEATHVR